MKGTQIAKSILGYGWAASAIVIVLATFMGLNGLSEALVRATGLRVSPWMSGDDVLHTVNHDGYRTLIRKQVFAGIVGERAEGFVQIDWTPEKDRHLPAVIIEELDVDGDGAIDFGVRAETATAKVALTPHQSWVKGIETAVRADEELIIRVHLLNPKK